MVIKKLHKAEMKNNRSNKGTPYQHSVTRKASWSNVFVSCIRFLAFVFQYILETRCKIMQKMKIV